MSRLLVMQSNVVRLDRRVYGDDGYLPGVQLDSENWARLFGRLPYAERVLAYIDTTVEQFKRGLEKLADMAVAGDLVLIQHSGHGTQQRDTNGDEDDGLDEVLCLHDGTFVDDNVWLALKMFRSGVRVLLITDTCHSGTMYRSFISDKLSYRGRDERAELNCELISIGTSLDKELSADTEQGGAGSSAMINTIDIADNYQDWVLRSQKFLRRNRYTQNMSFNAINAGEFINSTPLTLSAQVTEPDPVVADSNIKGVSIRFNNGTIQTFGEV